MLSKANIIRCILSILLAGYMVFAVILSQQWAASATAPVTTPLKILVQDVDSTGFVTRHEVSEMVKDFFAASGNGALVPSKISLLGIERLLNGVDNIEYARCTRRADDRMWIEVIPMRPVARVFDGNDSYYINRDGKRLTASLRYRCDVPFIQLSPGYSGSLLDIIPLIDYVNASKVRQELVTAYSIAPNGDMILVPPFRGHVINFGNPREDIANKFDRLLTMYRDVLPVKGWDFYDNLSVKFRGQVVATRRKPRERDPLLVLDPEGDASDAPDLSSMTVEP
ncbi:MAG: hypothetical protein K2G40_09995 [Muribaculaceae bacterium]|nr:hypothetical protein [Muribaculaceae bacterium]